MTTTVCIIGGGGQVAEGVSSWLAGRRHDVVHYRPKRIVIAGVPARPARTVSRLDKFTVRREAAANLDDGAGHYRWVDRHEARHADIFIYCLPSYLAEFIGFQLADAMHSKHIINVSDRFMGTAALCRAAGAVRPGWKPASATAFNSPPLLAYQRRRGDVTSLLYSKPFILAAPVHSGKTAVAESLIVDLFGIASIRWLPSTLDLAFENINSILHAVQDLHGLKTGIFRSPGSLYDAMTYTQGMVDRINAVTAERDRIASKASRMAYRGLKTFDDTTFKANSEYGAGTPTYRHFHPLLSTIPRPNVYSAHGYEDVGWSMVPLESFAKLLAVPTPALSNLIDGWNAYMRVDYRVVGRTANSLGITGTHLRRLMEI